MGSNVGNVKNVSNVKNVLKTFSCSVYFCVIGEKFFSCK